MKLRPVRVAGSNCVAEAPKNQYIEVPHASCTHRSAGPKETATGGACPPLSDAGSDVTKNKNLNFSVWIEFSAGCGQSMIGRRSAAMGRPNFWTSSGELKNWLLGCLWADWMKSHINRFVIISAFDWWKFRRRSFFSFPARGL